MLVEYVWVDHYGHLRSKTKVIYQKRPSNLKDLNLPFWCFKSGGREGDIVLKPQSVFPDPFRGGECIMVLCDTYTSDLKPIKSNTRHSAENIFKVHADKKPMYGINQEFFLMENNDPVGFSFASLVKESRAPPSPPDASHFYCGGGGNNVYGRECVEAAFKRCILSGINVTGMHVTDAPAQWKINLCAEGLAAADQLVMMRYILNRTAEIYGFWINYSPQPMLRWSGSGCHVNFSTEAMRDEGGYSVIKDAIVKLEKAHQKHIDNYGLNNDMRLRGVGGTSLFDTFTHSVGEGSVSVRIPNETFTQQKGYFEDRRPGGNMDPYVVTPLILETSLS